MSAVVAMRFFAVLTIPYTGVLGLSRRESVEPAILPLTARDKTLFGRYFI